MRNAVASGMRKAGRKARHRRGERVSANLEQAGPGVSREDALYDLPFSSPPVSNPSPISSQPSSQACARSESLAG